MSHSVILADDDDSIRLVLGKALTRAGYTVRATDNVSTLMKWVEKGEGDVLVTDVLMGEEEIFESLPDIRMMRRDLPVIVISAHANVKTAVKTGQHSVFDYIPKPFDLDEVTSAVARALKSRKPMGKPRGVSADIPMIGQSQIMQPVFRAISRFADTDLNLVIEGDVGTGKDLVVKLLHDSGQRSEKPLVYVGSMTPMDGLIDEADGGDIVIDDVSDFSPLRQQQIIDIMKTVGNMNAAQRPRFLTTTRHLLSKKVTDGTLRSDLYYRINQAHISLPLLKDRSEDIPSLLDSFVDKFDIHKSPARQFAPDAMAALQNYHWPGNVRELSNLVQRLLALYPDPIITKDMVQQEIWEQLSSGDTETEKSSLEEQLARACQALILDTKREDRSDAYERALCWIEKPLLNAALEATDGNRAKASDILGIHRNTLRTKLSALEE